MKKIPQVFLTNPLRVFIGPRKLSFSPMTRRLFTSQIPFRQKRAFPWERLRSVPILPSADSPAHRRPRSPGTLRFPIPPSRITKNIEYKCMFFSTVPKNHRKILGSHRIFLWIWHISPFSLCMSKKHWNFGHSRKKLPSMPRQRSLRA